MRIRLLFVMTLLVGALAVPAATANAQTAPTCGPYVTLTPSFGEPGTVVSVNLFHFAPNDEVDIILRVPGNPVVATGTTDDQGRANITFTMLDFEGPRVAILATASPCYAAGAYFEFAEVTPTPTTAPSTPTPAPTTPAATVTNTPATPGVTVTATPTKPAPAPTRATTPQAPIAGSGGDGGFGGTGTNLALVGLALVIFCGALTLWGSTRHMRTATVRSTGRSHTRIDRDPNDDQ